MGGVMHMPQLSLIKRMMGLSFVRLTSHGLQVALTQDLLIHEIMD